MLFLFYNPFKNHPFCDAFEVNVTNNFYLSWSAKVIKFKIKQFLLQTSINKTVLILNVLCGKLFFLYTKTTQNVSFL